MFPPLTSSSQNRVEGWALNNRLPEDERQLQLVVEVWVEPQHGVIMDSEIPEYLVGKQYFEIPAKVMGYLFTVYYLQNCGYTITLCEFLVF